MFVTDIKSCVMREFTYRTHMYCGDQLLVSLFDITNNDINVLYKHVITGSAHVTKLYITNLYKQDAIRMTRLQCICGFINSNF